MNAFEKTCLVALLCITGVACIALAMPWLVILGFFMLIIPGLILIISPSVAMYGWLFAIPYAALRTFPLARWKVTFTALLVPIVIGFGVPKLSDAVIRANLAAAVDLDHRPAQPLPISGAVALIRDDRTGGWNQRDNGCDDLCLRLLYNGDVKTVYLGQLGQPGMAFTIERHPVCPPFAFSKNEAKWHEWPRPATGRKGLDWPPPAGLKEIIEARIAGGDCLMRVSGRMKIDWMIKRTVLGHGDDLAPTGVKGERITVYRRNGPIMQQVGRFTNAYSSSALAMPLFFDLSGMEHTQWSWGRKTLGESRWDWDSVTALRSLVAFNPGLPGGTSSGRMRELLSAALSDPRRAHNDAGLLMANSVMVDIVRNGPKPGDAALIAKAIADERYSAIEARYELSKTLGLDYAVIVDSSISRLAQLPTSDDATFPQSALNTFIAGMPESWFASPPPRLTDLLRNPVIAARAGGIIYKLDAGGAKAVPLLTEIVVKGAERASSIEKIYERSRALDGANAAVATLCRIGISASSAREPIIAAKRKLCAAEDKWLDPNPVRYSAIWRGQKVNDGFVVTLTSLGVPITEFRAPDQPAATVSGSWQKMIMMEAKRHECRL